MDEINRAGPPANHDDRCEDFNTEPGVHYHAHDLPRCTDKAIVGWGNPPRWICERHLAERLKGVRMLVQQAEVLDFTAGADQKGRESNG